MAAAHRTRLRVRTSD